MSTESPTKPLTAAQAKKLVVATLTVGKLEAALAKAKEVRDELRARYKARIPASTDPKDAGKDVREIRAGDFEIRVSTYSGGEYFSLKDYLAAGNHLTPAMCEHIHEGDPRERWTVKDLRGPKHPDAVDPGVF